MAQEIVRRDNEGFYRELIDKTKRRLYNERNNQCYLLEKLKRSKIKEKRMYDFVNYVKYNNFYFYGLG